MTTPSEERLVTETAAGRFCQILVRYGPALLLAGYLLFAHGCHGDEDNELFGAGGHEVVPEPVPRLTAARRAARAYDPPLNTKGSLGNP